MMPEQLVEGIDYYVEKGFMVFTAHYLRNRGYCCESGCRHCPYGFVGKNEQLGHSSNSSPKEKAD